MKSKMKLNFTSSVEFSVFNYILAVICMNGGCLRYKQAHILSFRCVAKVDIEIRRADTVLQYIMQYSNCK